MIGSTSLSEKDIASVGSRISWGAIFAGAVLSLALYFLIIPLGAAMGLTLHESLTSAPVQIAVLAWNFVILSIALFLGGLVTSQFTVGEDRIEAMLYGVIMWAVLLIAVLVLGAAGIRSGMHVLMHHAAEGTASSPVTHVGWYIFAGTWITMLAAAAGAVCGAGPTFRGRPLTR